MSGLAKLLETFEVCHEMREMPRDKWPIMLDLESDALNVWMSKDYFAVLRKHKVGGMTRLAVCRVEDDGESISWDELQRVKNECLGTEVWCIENYPAESELVNVQNMRHLFVLDEPPEARFPTEAAISDEEVEGALETFKEMLARSGRV